MLNLEVARKALRELRPDEKAPQVDAACDILKAFIDDVEKLITHNSIKQVPILLSPKKGQ